MRYVVKNSAAGATNAVSGEAALCLADIALAAHANTGFCTVFWTGENLRMTLLSISAGGETGFAMAEADCVFRVEAGRGLAVTGRGGLAPAERQWIVRNGVLFVPDGTWYNIVNTGFRTLKLSSICALSRQTQETSQQAGAAAEQEAFESHSFTAESPS